MLHTLIFSQKWDSSIRLPPPHLCPSSMGILVRKLLSFSVTLSLSWCCIYSRVAAQGRRERERHTLQSHLLTQVDASQCFFVLWVLVLISQWHLCDPSLSEAGRFLAGTLVLPLFSPDFQAICLSKTCSVGVPLVFLWSSWIETALSLDSLSLGPHQVHRSTHPLFFF